MSDRQGSITVVGLGSGDEDQLTLGIWRRLQEAEHVYLRTAHHPVLQRLFAAHGLNYETFDHIYESKSSFPEVYEAIAEQLIQAARASAGDIVYAVPGHPMIAEATVQLLREKAAAANINLTILGGESFLDQAFLRLGFDPIAGFQLLDGSDFNAALLQPQLHVIVAQVYDTYTASDVKLGLMTVYPDDFPVVVAHALGVQGEERIARVPLYEMDRLKGYGNLSLIWVPATDEDAVRNRQFSRLKEIVTQLRSPDGCPWDRAQTHRSIRANLIEETYEVLETIDDDDPVAMCEELGDLLMQIMLHAEMEAEMGTFNIDDVVATLNEKLIRRHPHVFGDVEAGDATEALQLWQKIKAEERQEKSDQQPASILDGIPRELPSIMKALELQKRAAKVGFDWEELADVFTKLAEECAELQDVAYDPELQERQMEELGDALFALINVARFMNIDPDAALAQANRKFLRRFSYIEQKLRLKGRDFEHTNLIEMEAWWQEAKRQP